MCLKKKSLVLELSSASGMEDDVKNDQAAFNMKNVEHTKMHACVYLKNVIYSFTFQLHKSYMYIHLPHRILSICVAVELPEQFNFPDGV